HDPARRAAARGLRPLGGRPRDRLGLLLPPPRPHGVLELTGSMSAVIRLENVTLRYRVPREAIRSLKEYAIRRVQRRVAYDDFDALQSIDLQVAAGERVGVIGRNGAGKSTLFRVISRVLPPYQGRVYVAGR